jgi:hypothetical protein
MRVKECQLVLRRRAQREGMLGQVRRKATTIGACGAGLVRVYQLGHVFLLLCCYGDNISASHLPVNNYFAKDFLAPIPRLCYVFPTT